MPSLLRDRRRRFTTVLAIAAVLFGLVAWPGSGQAQAPPPVQTRDTLIDVVDGPSGVEQEQLDATLYAPASTPAPAVLIAHGFGGDKDGVADQARDLARRGFTVLTYSARGFGRSSGHVELNAPEYEVTDARQLIDWLARQPEVERDRDKDPRVGVTGGSYGGALSLLLAGSDPRVDAIAPVSTYNDLAQALLPNSSARDGVDPTTPAHGAFGPNGVFKRAWAGLLFSAGTSGDTRPLGIEESEPRGKPTNPPTAGTGAPEPPPRPAVPGPPDAPASPETTALTCGRLSPAVCRAYTEIAETGRPSPAAVDLLLRVSPKNVTRRIDAPTLLVQGEQDTLFGLEQADANAREIGASGTPVKTMWYSGGHDGGQPGPEVRRAIGDWFDFHLAGRGPDPGTSFQYDVPNRPGQREPDRSDSQTVTAPDYPGVRAQRTARFSLSLHGEPTTVLNPPGGMPAATSSLPGAGAVLGAAGALGQSLARDIPGQVATFDTDSVSQRLQITGSPQVRLRVSGVPGQPGGGEAVLFAKLYDIGPDGRRTLPGNGVAPIRVTGLPADGRPVDVTVALPGIVHPLEQGHRLQLAVSTTDQAYATPEQPSVHRVALGGEAALSVPSVRGTAERGESVPTGPLVGIGALLAFALFVALVSRIRRRSTDAADPDLTGTPLAISGLSKSYPGKLTAVRDLSFRIPPGQVVGLLGPNGAGKTTALRLMLGLLRPSAGAVHVFGHRVRPGAPVLSRVGALVESPGFLPHLSGLDNLKLYWRATSRPLLHARIDEVLDIAGLGDAARRKVATYSHGMRQRLAIAQAMLGMPDLLVLDEPTNGLDPPQLHQLRDVLRRYAATGRSVVISSHLLAEVERTCSHVVVMHHGELVAAGTVSEIVAVGDDVTFRVDAPEIAAEALRGLEGVGAVEVGDDQVHAELRDVSTSTAVSTLVDAEIAVEQVVPRRRLEDAFLQLVGEEETR